MSGNRQCKRLGRDQMDPKNVTGMILVVVLVMVGVLAAGYIERKGFLKGSG